MFGRLTVGAAAFATGWAVMGAFVLATSSCLDDDLAPRSGTVIARQVAGDTYRLKIQPPQGVTGWRNVSADVYSDCRVGDLYPDCGRRR